MHLKTVSRVLGLAFALLVTIMPAQLIAQGQPAASGPTTWKVQSGAGTPDSSVATLKFYPRSITVNVGDTISWSFVADAHTVTFLSGAPRPNPLDPSNESPIGGSTYDGTGVVSSGIVPPIPGMAYSVTFTKAGNFNYVCAIHPGMGGTVVVQDAGAAYPQTQAQIDAAAAPEEQQDTAAMVAAVQAFQPTSAPSASGATSYNYSMGLGNGSAASLRFLPTDATVKVGDSITWTNDDPVEPHTVTFAAANGQFPTFPADPAAAMPAGGSTYDGSALTSSGIAAPKGAPGNIPYMLTFTRPGTYKYVCTIHVNLGMVGTVTVQPSVPSAPPNTGVGPGPSRDSDSP